MDHRMSGIGKGIITSSSKPVYPFYKPEYSFANSPNPINYSFQQPHSVSPFRSPSYAKIENKIEKLNKQIEFKQERYKDKKLAHSFISLLNEYDKRAQVPPAPVKPATPKYNEMPVLFASLQKQQEIMLRMIENMNKKNQPIEETKGFYQNPVQNPQIQFQGQTTTLVEEQYKRVKENPQEFKRVLAELNFDDDEAELYADAEKRYRYDANLSDEEKFKILQKMAAEKRQREHEMRVVGLRGKSLFRAIGYAVLFPIMAISSLLEKKGKKKFENINNMESSIKIFTEVAKEWTMKAIKIPLTSILNDPKLDLSLSNKDNNLRETEFIKAKILKTQVRVKGILDCLRENTTEELMRVPLRVFIDKLIDDGSYIPQDYLMPFERSRLETDEFGALWQQNDNKRKMLVATFFISRIIVRDFCLNSQENHIPVRPGSKTQQNLRTIGSILQHIVLMTFCKTGRQAQEGLIDENEILARRKGEKLRPRNDDGISDKLQAVSEYEIIYRSMEKFFLDMQYSLDSWTGHVVRMVYRAKYK
ncbi:unnamed protein product [Blepharisma stoltei]|uniref:Uncharacterized protein n=1 Tax=Blepharisma stoltei TaxID=1481888 RepID=A0AAU9K7N5_9CILI|nr:unnamed protein product [Blepharisma stoltei]